jgi:hypothetical protein
MSNLTDPVPTPDWVLAQSRPRPAYSPAISYGAGLSAGQELQGTLPYINQANQTNLGYLSTAIPNYSGLMASQSGNIASLLNPTDFTDVQRRGAENAVASGTAGSPFADLATAKLTEDERIRRQLLGSEMLSGAVRDVPPPVNPLALVGRGLPAGQPQQPASFAGGGMPNFGPSWANLTNPSLAPIVSPGTATGSGGGVMDWLGSILNPGVGTPGGGGYSPWGPGGWQGGEAESPMGPGGYDPSGNELPMTSPDLAWASDPWGLPPE